jgi:hypothetical protein
MTPNKNITDKGDARMTSEAEEIAYERGIVVGWEKCLMEMSKFIDERKAQLKQFESDEEYEYKKKIGVFRKATEHPDHCIDLLKVKSSRVADSRDKDKYRIPESHHVLIIDMGEKNG